MHPGSLSPGRIINAPEPLGILRFYRLDPCAVQVVVYPAQNKPVNRRELGAHAINLAEY